MKPLSLTMKAFGPYAKEVVIPFEELAPAGLYLITGDTGAGKTTIFDAITYALFGEASGGLRNAAMLRSDYADPRDETVVSLTFAHAGKRYTITRTLSYSVPRSAQQEPRKKELCEFTDEAGNTRSLKVTEANQLISELLGISATQFKQIAMIAQGEFQKLLNASTKDREQIFKQVLGLQELEGFAAQIEQYKNEAQQAYESQVGLLEQESLRIKVAPADEAAAADADGGVSQVEELLAAQEVAVADPERFIAALKAVLTTDKTAASSQETAKQQVQSELQQVVVQLAKAQSINGALRAYRQAHALMQQAQALFVLVAPLQSQADKLYAEQYEQLGAKVHEMERQLGYFERFAAAQKELAAAAQATEASKQELAAQESACQKIKAQVQSFEAEQATLQHAGKERAVLDEKIQAMRGYYQHAAGLVASSRDLGISEAHVAELKQKFAVQSELFEQQNEKVKQLTVAFYAAQAGVLASQLEEGAPCPVCGSTSHPQKAQLPAQAPTEQDLEQAQKLLEGERKRLQGASEAVAQSVTALTEQQKTLVKRYKELLSELQEAQVLTEEQARNAAERSPQEITQELLASLQDTVETYGTQLRAQLDRAVQQETRFNELTTQIATQKEALATGEATQKELQQTVLAKETAKASAAQKVAQLQEELPACEQQELAHQLEVTRTQRARVKAVQEQVAAEVQAIQSRLITYDTQQKSALAQLASEKVSPKAELQDTETLEQQKAALSSRLETLEHKTSELTATIAFNQQVYDNFTDVYVKLGPLKRDYERKLNLHQTVQGSLSQADRLSFERYVIGFYFDQMLRGANRRLAQMTSHRFELERKTEGQDRRKQAGLDLDVRDRYTGVVRDVKSLSGGESFKASLALALGASDYIMSLAGGISIDALFVDEGFGTLDKESLDQALSVLSELAQGERTVGIISHVQELREVIERQIEVVGSKEGSTIKLHGV